MKLAAGAPRAILSVLVAVLGLGLLYANPAAATPRPEVVKEAERRFRRATELYHEGRYQEALFIYQGAYDLLPSVSILFNIGLTKEKLLDFAGCAEAFQRYLSEAASEKEAEAARAHLETCRGRAVLVVPVSSMPPGAAIYVGPPGEKPAFRGRTPARIELRPGKHVLAVEMQGYVRQSQELDLEIGGRPEADFILERLSTLRVESDVPGAAVQIGDAAPEPAPVEKEIQAGRYVVVVSHEGHQSIRKDVRVESGKQVQLSVSLPVLPKVRVVTIAGPAGARLSIDGAPPVAAPLKHELTAGEHRLVASAPGMVGYAARFVVDHDRDADLRLRLPPERSVRDRWVVRVLGGLAGASLVAGGAYGVMALSAESDYRDMPSVRLREDGMTYRATADILLGTGLTLVLATWLYHEWSTPPAARLERIR